MRYWITIVPFSVSLLAMIPLVVSGQGQQGSGSPYSAYGLGDLIGNPQVSQALMGGAGVALADPYSVIRSNPASYASLGSAVFETAMVIRWRKFETENVTAKGNRSDLLGFTLGMPFGRNRWGLAFGLNPMSQVGYNISDQTILPDGELATFRYSGNGGLNNAFIGLGRKFQLHRDSLGQGSQLSIGANMNYLFGNIDEVRKVYYPRNQGYYNSAVVSSLVLRAPMVNVGAQLTGILISAAKVQVRVDQRKERSLLKDQKGKADWIAAGKDPEGRRVAKVKRREGEALRYRIGVSSELPADLDAYGDLLVYSFIQGITGVEFPVDTVISSQGLTGELGIPVQMGLGFSLYNSRWTLTAEYRTRDWQQLKVNVEDLELADQVASSNTTILGGSFRPAGNGNGSIVQNIIYRAGFRYTNDYLVIGGEQLSDYGMAFGISLPIMGLTTRSRISLGAEFGEQGTTDNGLIRERYTHLYIGVTITPDLREKWLQKRRFE